MLKAGLYLRIKDELRAAVLAGREEARQAVLKITGEGDDDWDDAVMYADRSIRQLPDP